MERRGYPVSNHGRLATQQQTTALLRPLAAPNPRHRLIFRECIQPLSDTAMPPPARGRSPSRQWLPLYLDASFQRLLRYESDRRSSEFPLLSANPQSQYQNPGQAVWGNANQRIIQHTPVQRPQQQPPSSQPNNTAQQHQQSSQAQDQSQQARDDLYPGSQFNGGNDDYHRGGQGGVGQLGASSQPQPNSVVEFPPLGRNGTDEDQQDRRGSLMQNAAFGGFSNSTQLFLPPTQNQPRQGLPSAQSNQSDASRSSTLVERLASPTSLSFGECAS